MPTSGVKKRLAKLRSDGEQRRMSVSTSSLGRFVSTSGSAKYVLHDLGRG